MKRTEWYTIPVFNTKGPYAKGQSGTWYTIPGIYVYLVYIYILRIDHGLSRCANTFQPFYNRTAVPFWEKTT